MKYCQATQTVPNSAVTGQTTFMIPHLLRMPRHVGGDDRGAQRPEQQE